MILAGRFRVQLFRKNENQLHRGLILHEKHFFFIELDRNFGLSWLFNPNREETWI